MRVIIIEIVKCCSCSVVWPCASRVGFSPLSCVHLSMTALSPWTVSLYQRESELWDRNVFVVGWGKECCNNTVSMRGRWDGHQVGHQNQSIPRVNTEREVVNVLHP